MKKECMAVTEKRKAFEEWMQRRNGVTCDMLGTESSGENELMLEKNVTLVMGSDLEGFPG